MMSDKKISSIATFQVIAILAIISIRTTPFLSLYYDYDDPLFKSFFYAIKALARFAIPFLFMTAGYFWGRKINEGAGVRAQSFHDIKKLAVIFLAWSVIYGVIPYWIPLKTITQSGSHYDLVALLKDRPLRVLSEFRNEPFNFLMEGTCVLLWFFTALMIAIAILAFFISVKRQKYIIPFSVVLYLFGLLANTSTYSHTPLGIHLPIIFNTRNGPFFSTLFVSLGWWFSKPKRRLPSTRLILWMIFGGFVFQEMESFFLWKTFKVSLLFDYLIGTVPYSTGVFLLALAHPDIGKNTFFPKIGLLTLGIYVAHPLMQPYVQYFFSDCFNPVVWQILFPPLLLLFTAVFVYLLKKVPAVRNIVS